MGLRCTLLGHAYGEPVTERDREQRGDEEVVTTRKIRTCSRCGTETVLSENTEVRYLEPEGGEGVAERPAAEPESERVPAQEPTAGEPEPGTESATTTGQPADSEPDVADLVESAEGETPPTGTVQETEASEPETQEGLEPETQKTPEPEATEVSEPEPVEASESDTPAAPANEPPESDPETPDTEADEGIILDETTDRDPTPETGGLEESEEYSARSTTDEAATSADQANEADAVDDIEDLYESESHSSGPTGPAGDTNADDPVDETQPTAAPESMFGEGTDQNDRTSGSPSAETGTDSQSDPWKERPPTQESDESAQAEPERDDPAFQFGLQEEASGSGTESAEQATRGPAGIKSEGPLDVDSEPDSAFQSLECPECGFSESAQTSLRAGDICPDCHRGYLAGRR
ncbi:DUF7093 family protein [Halodesulfurarchaeum sp.]|uniref:DUF7093 family protein n=1 Tax=Halodesulfurarchaeum sp. TaxID=1980530 RepID=UPI001BBD832B|nr:hypothetical protein [Halodesulfurarchaeum sp.]